MYVFMYVQKLLNVAVSTHDIKNIKKAGIDFD